MDYQASLKLSGSITAQEYMKQQPWILLGSSPPWKNQELQPRTATLSSPERKPPLEEAVQWSWLLQRASRWCHHCRLHLDHPDKVVEQISPRFSCSGRANSSVCRWEVTETEQNIERTHQPDVLWSNWARMMERNDLQSKFRHAEQRKHTSASVTFIF